MELYLVESDSGKLASKKSNSWQYNATILVCLLLTFNVAAYLTEFSQANVRRSVDESFITLGIKFLNFCIAKSLQLRYIAPLQTQPSFTPLVFWVTLTQSVSSLYS